MSRGDFADRADPEDPDERGPLAFMAANPVAANLAMFLIIVGGLLLLGRIRQEVFPEVDLDQITVAVPYPGAAPEEVEQGVILAVEEEVRGVEGVKRVRSSASESVGSITAELQVGADADRALNDIKSAVDRITSFPQDAERPVVSLRTNRREVISLMVSGDVDLRRLRTLGESLRDRLLQIKGITLVDLVGVPDPEISVEVPLDALERTGLTLDQIAQTITASSVDLPGGGVKTAGGEVLLRTKEKRQDGEEFAAITLISRTDGTRITLGDVATVRDTLAENDKAAYFDGKPAVQLKVYRTGDQKPLDIAAAVKDFAERAQAEMPAGISLAVWNDSSEIFGDRINLLLNNGAMGLTLVLVLLGLFLKPSQAFWVTMGMVISFCGAFVVMPAIGVTINMISLFAFILTLGIVVDDAIVVGEAVHYHSQRGKRPLAAALAGVREVAVPVSFSVLTTVIAFTPLLFIPGLMGKFFSNIPAIVIPILLFSLAESLLILPAHLSHGKTLPIPGLARFTAWQQRFSEGFDRWTETKFDRFIRAALGRRGLILSGTLALLIVAFGVLKGGRLAFTFMPKIEGDIVMTTVELPFGAPVAETRAALDQVQGAARRVLAGLEGGSEGNLRGLFSQVGSSVAGSGPMADASGGGSHVAQMTVQLRPMGERTVTAREFAQRLRAEVGEMPGVERFAVVFNIGPSAGADVSVELSHRSTETLNAAAKAVAGELAGFAGVQDINDGFQEGKPQLDMKLKDAARAQGITQRDLARQLRSAFFGAEAVRQQRGRDEVRTYVRLPPEERHSLYHLERMRLRTPQGGEIPLGQAASIHEGTSHTVITREDGRRVVTVTADVNPDVTNAGNVTAALMGETLPDLAQNFPGLTFRLSGAEEERKESMSSLGTGMLMALLAMYALMAVAFRSYTQPLLVMAAIPLGVVGAFGGHLLMGFDLSLISMLGIVALAGVVVNDNLVLLDAINANRRQGMPVTEAVVQGSVRRLRPVLLTSLTTFLGLAPMIFETSVQARFLVPMTISLGYGVLFVTVITILIVPCLYLTGAKLLKKE